MVFIGKNKELGQNRYGHMGKEGKRARGQQGRKARNKGLKIHVTF
jgi:hypothetical protein